MRVTLLEPFYTGSHKLWADGLIDLSSHDIRLYSLPGRHWKWRMHGAAPYFANQLNLDKVESDLILASDLMDVSVFRGLLDGHFSNSKVVTYFHENQITYPWSPSDHDPSLQRDRHYGFINFTTALASDACFFNSKYHMESFLGALPEFLSAFPDFQLKDFVPKIKAKSKVLHLGMDLKKLDLGEDIPEPGRKAVLLWNHRWEYDKNPEAFFNALFELKKRGVFFELIVLGESFARCPEIFAKAKGVLKEEILHFGYAKDFEDYKRFLWKADILPVTSNQDFFGGSVVEAMYCNCIPLLPKRLAYPEHVPEKLHSSFFYEEDEFVNRLQRMIFNVNILRKQNVRQFVEHYDWKHQAPVYDDALQAVLDTNP